MERYILEALQKGVTQAVLGSDTPALPIKYMFRSIKTPNDGKWLEIIHIPNNVTGEFWGDEKTHQGLLRLILHWPINDEGAYEPLDVMKSITDHFSKGSTFQDLGNNVNVKITDKPNILNIIETSPTSMIAVSIRYSYFNS